MDASSSASIIFEHHELARARERAPLYNLRGYPGLFSSGLVLPWTGFGRTARGAKRERHTSRELALWRLYSQGRTHRAAQRRRAFQALSQADVYHSRDLHQDWIFPGSRSSKERPARMGTGSLIDGQRVPAAKAQNIIQNSLTSLGDAAVKFEPRYDRCRDRLRHCRERQRCSQYCQIGNSSVSPGCRGVPSSSRTPTGDPRRTLIHRCTPVWS